VNLIVEIDEHSHQAKSYSGNYETYLARKAIERARWKADFEQQQEEIKALRREIKVSARNVNHNRPARDNDKFWIGFKDGRTNVAIARRVASAEERLARIEADPIPRPPEPLSFEPEFDPQTLKGRLPLVTSGLVKTYGGRRVLDDVSFSVSARSRIVLVGPNGAGKTTLLRLLSGVEAPDRGEVILNPQVRIGYLDQEQQTLNPNQTVLEAYRHGRAGDEQRMIAVLLGSGFFRYDELARRVGQLSSGMKRKLQIARLIAERANLLLLDEPTNYVSFDVLEAFEDALVNFPGPIIAVSHDRRFMSRFAGEIWELNDGHLQQ
jgi:macrolide transport system ATP-binding/permease protein